MTFEQRSTRLFYALASPAALRPVAPAQRSFLSALGRSQRPSGAWGGAKNRPSQRPTPLFLAAPHHSLGGVFLALGHDFRTENAASRTLFTTPVNLHHRLFTFFLLTISTT